MKLEIDTVSSDAISYETFARNYLLPERPLLVTGVDIPDPTVVNAAYVKHRYLNNTSRRPGWVVAGLEDDGVLMTPPLVQRVLARDDVYLSPIPVRLFLQPGGHTTLPHFDGNSLHGFNVQVQGSKRWIIVSPDSPLPSVPFTNIGMPPKQFDYATDDRYDSCEFTTAPGDMVFLPRYWFHEVWSLEHHNLNFNWVFTPASPNESSRTARRENELAAIAARWPLLDRLLFFSRFKDYGGRGYELAKRYGRDVSAARMINRVLREMVGFPVLLLRLRHVLAGINEYKRNNFRVTPPSDPVARPAKGRRDRPAD